MKNERVGTGGSLNGWVRGGWGGGSGILDVMSDSVELIKNVIRGKLM